MAMSLTIHYTTLIVGSVKNFRALFASLYFGLFITTMPHIVGLIKCFFFEPRNFVSGPSGFSLLQIFANEATKPRAL
jgi:hypothetical protein